MTVDMRKDGERYRTVTEFYGVARWGSEWTAVDRETGAQVGRWWPRLSEAIEYAEERQRGDDIATAEFRKAQAQKR